ncbi:MAG: hypothetical protein GX875_06095, partial [Propionibacterium sp.]|nr:hypothetical protein [Propionibacterium sp.]
MTLDAPLAGRELRFWPETILGGAAMKRAAERSQLRRHDQEELERQRLLYVALTRAKSRIVLAPEGNMETSSLFESSRLSADGDERVSFKLKLEDPNSAQGKVILEYAKSYVETAASKLMDGDPVCVECTVVDIAPIEDDAGTQAVQSTESSAESVAPPVFDPYEWLDIDRATQVGLHADANAVCPGRPIDATRLPAAFTASGVKTSSSMQEAARIRRVAQFGDVAPLEGSRGSAEIGDCVHAYLAAPVARLQPHEKEAVAQRLIAAWGVEQHLRPTRLVEYGDRWADWLEQTYPGARVETEVPITWQNSQHQRMQGWIDQLITTPSRD